MTQSADATEIPLDTPLPEIRKIAMSDLGWALSEGWRDFTSKRGDLLFIGLLYPVVCLVAVVAASNEPVLPLFFPVVAGLSIAGPAVASGFYELARRREEGRDTNWWHFLDPLNGRSRLPIAALTLGLAILFVAWLGAAYAIYSVTLGATAPMTVGDVFGRLFTSSEGLRMIVIGNLVGFLFAVVALIYGVASFPMVVDKPVDAITALRTSIAAFRKNPAEVFGWGLRVAALLFIGTLPFAIGLAIVLPWLGYATWHLYTRLVVR